MIVATNAFGMGVDKPNVRFVYHYGITESLDRIIRKLGERAVMAKKRRQCSSFASRIWAFVNFLAVKGSLQPEQIEKWPTVIGDQGGPVTEEEIADKTDLSQRKLSKAIRRLEDVGALEVLLDGVLAA